MFRWVILGVFGISFLWIGSFGAGTDQAYVWPGLMVLGGGGVLFAFAVPAKCKLPDPLCLVFLLLFVGYVFLRAWISPISYSNRADICLLGGCLLVYLLFSTFVSSNKSRGIMVCLLVSLAVGNLVVSLYQMTQDSTFHIRPGESRQDRVKGLMPSGFYFTHDHMAGFLQVAALFSLGMGLIARVGAKVRVLFLFSAILCLGGIAMSMSRGGFLSAGAGMFGFGVLTYIHARGRALPEETGIRKVLLTGMVCLLVGFAVVGSMMIVKRFNHSGHSKIIDLDKDIRLTNWNLAIEQWELAPIIGTGSRTYDNYSVKLWPVDVPRVSGHPVFAHNDYLQLLAEYGLIGLVLGGGVLCVHVRKGLRPSDVDRRRGFFDTNEAMRIAAISSLLAYSVHSFFDFNLHLLSNAIPVAFSFAVLAGGRKVRDVKGGVFYVSLLKVIGICSGVSILVFGYRISKAEYHRVKMEHSITAEDYLQAISHGSKSIELDPKNYLSHRFLGFARARLADSYNIAPVSNGFYEKAIGSFESCLAVNTWDIIALREAGRCFSKLKRYKAASEAFESAIALGPLEFESHLYNAYHYSDWGVDLLEQGKVERGIETLWKSHSAYRGAIKADYSRIRPVSVADDNYKAFLEFFADVLRSQALIYESIGDTKLADGLITDAIGAFEECRRWVDAEMALPKNDHIETARRNYRLKKKQEKLSKK